MDFLLDIQSLPDCLAGLVDRIKFIELDLRQFFTAHLRSIRRKVAAAESQFAVVLNYGEMTDSLSGHASEDVILGVRESLLGCGGWI